MNYRRVFLAGGTYFFTLVTYQRQPVFAFPDNVALLRDAFRYTMDRHPFNIVASVVLPDHLHCIWTLPAQEKDYALRWRLIKSHFSHHWQPETTRRFSASRSHKGEKLVWQRRYWEHLIRDEVDLTHHIDYIHYNPVKHGLTDLPGRWAYSSLRRYIQDGLYPADWGTSVEIWPGVGRME